VAIDYYCPVSLRPALSTMPYFIDTKNYSINRFNHKERFKTQLFSSLENSELIGCTEPQASSRFPLHLANRTLFISSDASSTPCELRLTCSLFPLSYFPHIRFRDTKATRKPFARGGFSRQPHEALEGSRAIQSADLFESLHRILKDSQNRSQVTHNCADRHNL
jgi:hypothetical protein